VLKEWSSASTGCAIAPNCALISRAPRRGRANLIRCSTSAEVGGGSDICEGGAARPSFAPACAAPCVQIGRMATRCQVSHVRSDRGGGTHREAIA
jgi:hypothetical protein